MLYCDPSHIGSHEKNAACQGWLCCSSVHDIEQRTAAQQCPTHLFVGCLLEGRPVVWIEHNKVYHTVDVLGQLHQSVCVFKCVVHTLEQYVL